jgi:hypothetical protein
MRLAFRLDQGLNDVSACQVNLDDRGLDALLPQKHGCSAACDKDLCPLAFKSPRKRDSFAEQSLNNLNFIRNSREYPAVFLGHGAVWCDKYNTHVLFLQGCVALCNTCRTT